MIGKIKRGSPSLWAKTASAPDKRAVRSLRASLCQSLLLYKSPKTEAASRGAGQLIAKVVQWKGNGLTDNPKSFALRHGCAVPKGSPWHQGELRVLTKSRKNEALIRNDGVYVISGIFCRANACEKVKARRAEGARTRPKGVRSAGTPRKRSAGRCET